MDLSNDFSDSRYLCLNNRRLTVLGDSEMMRVHLAMRQFLNCTNPFVRFGSRCDEDVAYLSLTRATTFVQPTESVGPVGYGLQNLGAGCRDCGGCNAALARCDGDHADVWSELEFIAVEFAKDVSIQTDRFPTTQENVAWYLKQLPSPEENFVVVNTGLHDTALRDSRPEAYLKNLE